MFIESSSAPKVSFEPWGLIILPTFGKRLVSQLIQVMHDYILPYFDKCQDVVNVLLPQRRPHPRARHPEIGRAHV